MAKWLPVFLLLIASLTTGCCTHNWVTHPAERPTFVDALRGETVALVHKDSDGDVAVYCSGVWVSRTEILTADHCAKATIELGLGMDADDDKTERMLIEVVEKDFQIEYVVPEDYTGVYRDPKAIHVARVQSFDYEHDLALLVVSDPKDAPDHGVAPLAGNSPRVGEQVHMMGHPAGLGWSYTHGVVSAYREMKFKPIQDRRTGPWLQVSGEVWKGNSGGGAYNDAGELVGICSFMGGGPNTTFFVHLTTVKNFLMRWS